MAFFMAHPPAGIRRKLKNTATLFIYNNSPVTSTNVQFFSLNFLYTPHRTLTTVGTKTENIMKN
jgi:hypothetical protein